MQAPGIKRFILTKSGRYSYLVRTQSVQKQGSYTTPVQPQLHELRCFSSFHLPAFEFRASSLFRTTINQYPDTPKLFLKITYQIYIPVYSYQITLPQSSPHFALSNSQTWIYKFINSHITSPKQRKYCVTSALLLRLDCIARHPREQDSAGFIFIEGSKNGIGANPK